ncbi:MAG TPA: hypothetical protein PLH46_00920 [Caldisericia bacterium]|nr:hypothetical protein [Caldisericia bacterium]
MEIKKLSVANFKSFKKEETFSFDKVNGLIFVSGKNNIDTEIGSNGSGKSSFFSDAITWSLFGKTASGLKSTSVKNWDSDSCRIVLEFDNYILERIHKPNTLKLNNKPITQEELEKLLGLNSEIFKTAVVIDQFSEKFIDMTPAKRFELFTEIMYDELNKWDKLRDIANTNKKVAENEIKDLKNNISFLEREIETLKNDLNNLTELSKGYKSDIVEKKKSFEQEINEIETEINKIEKEIKNLKYEETKELEKERNLIRSEVIRKNTEISIIDKEVNKFKTIGNVCPTCNRKIDKEFLEEKITELEEEKAKIVKEREELDIIVTKISTELENLEKINNDIAKKEKESILKKKELETNLKNVKNNLSKLKNTNPYEKMIKQKTKLLQEKQENKIKCEADLQNKTRFYEIYKFWISGFKEIGLNLLYNSLKELEMFSNRNISLLGIPEWKLSFEINHETKTGGLKSGIFINILTPSNSEYVPYEGLSGGEAQRIRIAVSVALSEFIEYKKNMKYNVMVLDEPSQHLSEEGINDLLSFLKYKSNDTKIFYIDHRNLESSGYFDYIINVVKNEGGSKIELQ